MSILDNIMSRIVDRFMGGLSDEFWEQQRAIVRRRRYYYGDQPAQLRTKPNSPNYNLTFNFIKKIANSNVSLLFGKELRFSTPKGGETAKEYIENVLKENKQAILLHNLGKTGGEGGQAFLKFIPQAEGTIRLVVLDPALMTVKCAPDDKDYVIEYRHQYKSADDQGREVAHLEVTTRGYFEVQQTADGLARIVDSDLVEPTQNWAIRNYEASVMTGGRWQLVSEELWPYDFAPIHDWQNYPCPTEHWGLPDYDDDEMRIQDAINGQASNINKLIFIYGHPQRYGRSLGEVAKIEIGPDEMPSYNNPDAAIEQLEPLGDIPAAMNFLAWEKKSLFDITQTPDLDSLQDRLGQLTNFGLRVLMHDALSKLETKRAMYGEGLKEVFRRLLIIAGMAPVEIKMDWQDPLPRNELELLQADKLELDNGTVDKKTIAEENGRDWETVSKNLEEEQRQQEDIGADLLRKFEGGQVKPRPFGQT